MVLTFWIGGMVLFGLSALLSGQTYIAQYSMRPSAPISTNPEYPEMHKGLPYRRNDDGSVAVLTANGPHTYKSWREFWDAMERMYSKSRHLATSGERAVVSRRSGAGRRLSSPWRAF